MLGMKKVVSEDSARRNLKKLEQIEAPETNPTTRKSAPPSRAYSERPSNSKRPTRT
jgi:hypothetical protein